MFMVVSRLSSLVVVWCLLLFCRNVLILVVVRVVRCSLFVGCCWLFDVVMVFVVCCCG